MHQISLVFATLLKRSSPATCGRIRTSVYAREQPQSAYMRAHRASMFICAAYACVCCSRVSVWEELNTWTSITVMWATWDPAASLHHGHRAITSTAATECRWGRGAEGRRHMREEVEDKKHTHSWLCIYIWEWIWETEIQTDANRETDSRVTSVLHDNSVRCLSSASLFIYFCLSCQPWV